MILCVDIMQVCVSPDSRQILTVSGDKTAKIWDVSTSSVVQLVYLALSDFLVE